MSIRLFCVLKLLSTAMLLLGVGACAPAEDEITCGPEDQRDSYMPKLGDSFPVSVQLDAGFSQGPNSQREAVLKAIETWNQYAQSNLGYSFFNVQDSARASVERVATESEFCKNSGSLSGFSFNIVTEAAGISESGSKLSAAMPAMTVRCYQDKRLSKQVVLLHTVHANANLTSIALHELGHAIGLDHSCSDGAGSPGYRACKEVGRDHPYFIAVMYPVFRVHPMSRSPMDIKHNLQLNDKERAKCRYTGQ